MSTAALVCVALLLVAALAKDLGWKTLYEVAAVLVAMVCALMLAQILAALVRWAA